MVGRGLEQDVRDLVQSFCDSAGEDEPALDHLLAIIRALSMIAKAQPHAGAVALGNGLLGHLLPFCTRSCLKAPLSDTLPFCNEVLSLTRCLLHLSGSPSHPACMRDEFLLPWLKSSLGSWEALASEGLPSPEWNDVTGLSQEIVTLFELCRDLARNHASCPGERADGDTGVVAALLLKHTGHLLRDAASSIMEKASMPNACLHRLVKDLCWLFSESVHTALSISDMGANASVETVAQLVRESLGFLDKATAGKHSSRLRLCSTSTSMQCLGLTILSGLAQLFSAIAPLQLYMKEADIKSILDAACSPSLPRCQRVLAVDVLNTLDIFRGMITRMTSSLHCISSLGALLHPPAYALMARAILLWTPSTLSDVLLVEKHLAAMAELSDEMALAQHTKLLVDECKESVQYWKGKLGKQASCKPLPAFFPTSRTYIAFMEDFDDTDSD